MTQGISARKRRLALLGLLLAAGLVTDRVAAEPYLAVYKGMQCSACHSHPAGGGKRTVYGNAFAQSEMPADRIGAAEADLWTGEITEWLSVGADLRAGYEHTDVPNADETSEFRINRGALYLEASLIPNRLSLYVDQQFAPGTSQNREAYVRIMSAGRKFHFAAGQFYLPYGLRLQDDSAFIRQVTGINFFTPDRGVQVGYEEGPWSTQLSVTNGSGGASETDTGKRVSWVAQFVRQRWRAGASFNFNDADAGDRQMQNLFAGLRTGPVVWLAEADWIRDDLPSGAKRDVLASLIEGNWLFRRGHNLKVSYEFFDPNDDVDEDHQARWSLVWEYTPIQFLQGRIGARFHDGVPQVDQQNRDEYFAEIHGFF
ncbi:MAG: hypothetical protein WD448_11995 [Woeseia sp.]